MGLRREERSTLSRSLCGEVRSVHEAHGRADRIDPEPGPRKVQERHRRDDDELHAIVSPQQLYGALRYEWRSRDQINDLAVIMAISIGGCGLLLEGRSNDRLDYLVVNLGEGRSALVDVVECDDWHSRDLGDIKR